MLNSASTPYTHGTKHPHQYTQRPQKKQVHLSAERQRDLVAQYATGSKRTGLANAYGIDRNTVSAILKRHGVAKRVPLTDTQLNEAAVAYTDGDSLATIAKRYGVSDHTVRSRLLERSVKMRPAGGRRRGYAHHRS